MANDDIQGQITDSGGTPISNATVALWNIGSPNSVITRGTDSNGKYKFGVHPDGDGTTQNWFVSMYDSDRNNQYHAIGKPNVEASLPKLNSLDTVFLSRDDYTSYYVDQNKQYTVNEATSFNLGVSQNSQYFAYAGDDTNVYVYNKSDGTRKYKLTKASDQIFNVDMTEDYVIYGPGNGDDGVYVHNLSDGSLIHTFTNDTLTTGVALNGTYAAYGGSNFEVSVHNLSDGSVEYNFDVGTQVREIDLSNDYLVYTTEGEGEGEGGVEVRRLSDGTLTYLLKDSSTIVEKCSITSEYVAYGDSDGNVYLYDLSDGSLIRTFSNSDNANNGVSMSNQYIGYGSDSGVYIHNLYDYSLEYKLAQSERGFRDVSLYQ